MALTYRIQLGITLLTLGLAGLLLLSVASVASGQLPGVAPPDSLDGDRDAPPFMGRAPKRWFVSLGGGLAQGDQVFQNDTNLFATASVAAMVSRSVALGIVGAWMPSSKNGALNCIGGDCATLSTTTSSILELAAAFRLSSFSPRGLGPYAEIAPAIFFGHWTREERQDGGAQQSRSVDEVFAGIHLGLVFPFNLGPSSGIELGVRYIYSAGVNLAPLLGVEGESAEGLRLFQIYGAFAHRF